MALARHRRGRKQPRTQYHGRHVNHMRRMPDSDPAGAGDDATGAGVGALVAAIITRGIQDARACVACGVLDERGEIHADKWPTTKGGRRAQCIIHGLRKWHQIEGVRDFVFGGAALRLSRKLGARIGAGDVVAAACGLQMITV